ncbi:MAG: 2,3-diphosphoglycerate-dependent phosphoglycerate mutase [Gammaproteobacteria bacterium]|nr:2,3-diphosphoglycerate-dependent phosphoglycerate mutase [Gammaproteobacteria bacterium]
MTTLVLVRHGQSMWNLENRFTGWADVDLSERGIDEAREAGNTLKEHDFTFDVTMTSYLKRSIRTLWVMLDALDQMHLPIQTDWRLNERHYGALQGLDKRETVAQHGEEQVLKWRRGFSIRPPAMALDDPERSTNHPRYRGLGNMPDTESLADTLIRVTRWWHEALVPLLTQKKRVLVVAHGNSLRALVKYIDNMSEEDILNFNIPTGIPLIYKLDNQLSPRSRDYLADSEKLSLAIDEIKNQVTQDKHQN